MILYHGSNTEIGEIQLSKCQPYKDFGRGFYTTFIKDQAWSMAKRTVKFFGGSPCITVFSIQDDVFASPAFHVKQFTKPSAEWAAFVINNRNRQYGDISSPDCNHDNKYDGVIGPVANDDLTLLFDLFTDGIITIEELTRRMEYKKLSNQVSFHSDSIIAALQKIEAVYG
jgi:hypothetical protein